MRILEDLLGSHLSVNCFYPFTEAAVCNRSYLLAIIIVSVKPVPGLDLRWKYNIEHCSNFVSTLVCFGEGVSAGM